MLATSGRELTAEEKVRFVVTKALSGAISPNTFQKALYKAIFKDNKKFVFARCGRKAGKTQGVVDTAWRFANLKEERSVYYIAPLVKQAREILWVNGRLQNYGPRELIKHIDKQDLRITFQNGSFIKVDGSDNYDAWAGLSPHLVILDEFRGFRPQFYEVMNPNRAPHNAPLVIIGTPPPVLFVERDVPHQYIELWNQCVKEEREGGDSCALHFPSWVNDKVDGLLDWFAKEKAKLQEMGQDDVFRREYGAEFVESSAVSIFPVPEVFDENRLVRPLSAIKPVIEKYHKDIDYVVSVDPSSTTCFAALFGAHDKANSKVYTLDEIYEKKQYAMSVDVMWPRIRDKMIQHGRSLKNWTLVYDSAAAWFYNEVVQRFPNDVTQLKGFSPTNKVTSDRMETISLMKDIMRLSQTIISDLCQFLIFEIKNYQINAKDGKPVKRNDHLLDCYRYKLMHVHFELNVNAQGVVEYTFHEERIGSYVDPEPDLSPPEIEDAFFGELYE